MRLHSRLFACGLGQPDSLYRGLSVSVRVAKLGEYDCPPDVRPCPGIVRLLIEAIRQVCKGIGGGVYRPDSIADDDCPPLSS